MKTIVLNKAMIVDGIRRAEGEIVHVHDDFSDEFTRRVLRKFKTSDEKLKEKKDKERKEKKSK